MAHFYGTLQGGRGKATRCGTKNSGMATVAASWQGAVSVSLYAGPNGQDCAIVCLVPWRGVGTQQTIYDGPVSGMAAKVAA